VDEDAYPDEQHEALARALDLHGEGTEHRAQHAANDAVAVAAFYQTLTANDIPAESAVALTLEWMHVGHTIIDEGDDE
jgi:hypothetical protein